MTAETATQQTENSGGLPPAPSPQGEHVGKPVDDLATLLSQFEAETAPPDKQPEINGKATNDPNGKPGTEDAPPPDPISAAVERMLRTGQGMDELRQQIGVVQNIAQRQRFFQDKADFENIVSYAGRELADAGVPKSDEYVPRWLIAEANMNNDLRTAFHQRYETPDLQARAEKQIRKAVDRLRQAARREPDPVATADRELVSAAVRGASRTVMPPAPPPNYGDMTDAEFAREKAKYGVG